MPDDRSRADLLDEILAKRAIDCLFQPIVDLPTGLPVGFEALARGPAGTSLADPDSLFGLAATVDRLSELDWVCRAAACRAALLAGLPADLPLFINVEPTTARGSCPRDLVDIISAAVEQLQIVAEVTERSVAKNPASLLAVIEELRAYNNRIALDDVGADDSSQALMSLLRPDVIKFDRGIVQGRTTPAAAGTISAVLAEAERTGAVILAEGIETPQQAAFAQAMGATLGQGWLFGRPEPLPRRFPPSALILPRTTSPPSTGATPFEVACERRPVNRASKSMLLAISRHLEDKGVTATEPTVLLSAFQHVRYFDAATLGRYTNLATQGVFTATFATGMPTDPGPHIRGCALADDDPLVGEWVVIVIGSHFAGGLFARELPSEGAEDERPFDIVVSYDRDLVLEAARPLMRRLTPLSR